MASTTSWQAERMEVEAVLHSGIFGRAPNLESFFRYVCEHHFRGQAEQLKEYNIAVEALGRAAEFDQKKDSIVRVEAHRLRKRLSGYYAGQGADHAIQILIPLGSYAPEFIERPTPERVVIPAPQAEVPAEVMALVEATPLPGKQVPTGWLLVLLLLIVGAGFVKWRFFSSDIMASQSGNEVWRGPQGEGVPAEFRMLAGYRGDTFSDGQGREWHADAYYSGGRSMTLPPQASIQGISTFCFLKTARTGRFHYDIPVREGIFELHLYFAETEYGLGNPKGGGDGSRLFRLTVNGKEQVTLFDVHAQAGGANRLLVRVLKDISRAADGKIHIAFEPLTGMAILNGVEILPSAAGRIRPIRIVAQDHPVTDPDGQVWAADEYAMGGTLVLRRDARFSERDFAIYQGERFGNFTYHIPVAPGKYRLKLYFAETYFGTPSSTGNPEHRLFEVYANGVALVRKLDLLKEAGGPNKGIEKVFDGLEPNAQGELALQFVPLANYAEVNAIEVIETE